MFLLNIVNVIFQQKSTHLHCTGVGTVNLEKHISKLGEIKQKLLACPNTATSEPKVVLFFFYLGELTLRYDLPLYLPL